MTKKLIAERLMALRKGEMLPVGAVSKALKQMSPGEQRAVMTVVNDVLDEEGWGSKHGLSREFVSSQYLANTPAMSKFIDHLQVDDLAVSLMAKRGTDADRELPPPDRRDYIRASIDALGASDE